MEMIATSDAAARLAELVDRTAQGETFEITQDGRTVAKLVPAGQDQADAIGRMRDALRGTFRGTTVADIRRMAHEGHKY